MDLPLFPLSGVLLPCGRVPLQIFEQRYLDLVRDSLKSGTEFGVIWIRRGAEVAQRGSAAPELGDYGTTARIVDWDQLPNGLLGVTIEGGQRFDLESTRVGTNGLVVGAVQMREPLPAATMDPTWQSLLDVLHSLEIHPHIQAMGLQIDYDNAWQVAYSLIQVLPLDEALKYELLGLDSIEELIQELDAILNQISGED